MVGTSICWILEWPLTCCEILASRKRSDESKASGKSRYGGFLSHGGTPKSSIDGFALINQPFRDTHIYGTPHIFLPLKAGNLRGFYLAEWWHAQKDRSEMMGHFRGSLGVFQVYNVGPPVDSVQLVNISTISLGSMVVMAVITIVRWGYKPTYN